MKIRHSDLDTVCRAICPFARAEVISSADEAGVRFRLSYDAPGLLEKRIVVEGTISAWALAVGDRHEVVKRLDEAAHRLQHEVIFSGVLERARDLAGLATRAIDWSNLSEAAKAVLDSGWQPVERDEAER